MKNVLMFLVLGALAWYGIRRYQEHGADAAVADDTPGGEISLPEVRPEERFSCDGRKHCGEMSSCEEANWFLENCPGVKMDGDRDGNPCEEDCGH